MRTIVVSSTPADGLVEIPGAVAIQARDYLTDAEWTRERHLRVVNLCRSYRYQSDGYYVSLLATARRHRPFPDLRTVLDMRSRHFVRTVDEDLDALIQTSLADIDSPEFVLSVYFGKNLAQRHTRLANRLAALFPAPLLRARFRKSKRWRMTSIAPIAFRDVPESHRAFAAGAAGEWLVRPVGRSKARRNSRFGLAILYDPHEQLAPSDKTSIARFQRAARRVGFDVELIQRNDYGRLAEFDALFLRETTAVDHHTFRFAQRAEVEGMVVIDDPTSILRCTNKVYLAEAFEQRGVPTPKTLVTDSVDADRVEKVIGFPCVLKVPDSSFSQGVLKCADRAELEQRTAGVFEHSDLVLIQEYLPTDFDWRVGVFERAPLYACRYLMAAGHWQIVKKTGSGGFRYGRVEPVALSEVPPRVLKAAVRAANVIGDGLYGVDVKVQGRRIAVTEVNDNPNINAGCEDAILGDELYLRIMRGLFTRLQLSRNGAS